jgi:hypothetical protein
MNVFTGSKIDKLKAFGGANGDKISIEYSGTSYMLKFPPKPSSKIRKISSAGT